MSEVKRLNIQYHEDDRAQRYLNIFDLKEGQINVSYVSSDEHVVAWHMHKKQYDYWTCLKGAFKVGLAYPESNGNFKVKWEYLSDKNPTSIEIPPGVYHGYKALKKDSIMLYFLTEKYDKNDEFKVLPGHFGENWSTKSR